MSLGPVKFLWGRHGTPALHLLEGTGTALVLGGSCGFCPLTPSCGANAAVFSLTCSPASVGTKSLLTVSLKRWAGPPQPRNLCDLGTTLAAPLSLGPLSPPGEAPPGSGDNVP